MLEYLKKGRDSYTGRDKAIRNYLIALLMLDAGLRVGEAIRLVRDDLVNEDKPTETLVIRAEITKTKQERIVPLTLRIQNAICDFLAIHKIKYNIFPRDFMFPGQDCTKHITVRTIELLISTASARSFGRAITPHTLRHTFATRLMQRTNIRVVQKLLGHTSIASTQVYTHPNQDDLINAIKSIE